MKPIQDRIIKDFKEKFSTTWIKTKYSQIGINPNDNGKSWLVNPDEVEQFLIKSIKEVQEEIRKETKQEIAELKIKVIDLTNHCKNL